MAWYENLWPFGREARVRRRKIEAEFEAQLKEAYERRGDIDDVAQQLRENRDRTSTPPTALQGSDT